MNQDVFLQPFKSNALLIYKTRIPHAQNHLVRSPSNKFSQVLRLAGSNVPPQSSLKHGTLSISERGTNL